MSRQNVFSELPNEKEMSSAFTRSTEDILANQERFIKRDNSVMCGLEIEYGLINKEGEPALESERDFIRENTDFTDMELGAAQIEMRTEPVDLQQGSHILLDQVIERESRIIQLADQKGLSVVKSGTNPFVEVKKIKRSSAPKYKIVPDFHNTNRRKDLDTIIGKEEKVDIGDAAIIGLTNSVQLNIEAKNFTDSIDILNRSFGIGPMVVSAFSNARFLELKDTKIEDLRMIGWERSHDTRTKEDLVEGRVTRIGLPEKYYSNLEEYFTSIGEYPFILNAPQNALQVGLGLNWKDTRIKVIEDSLVVEFRPVSTQSTAEESFAAMMFYLGRLLWSQINKESLLPIELVKQNREEAMNYGLKAKLWTLLEGRYEKISAREALMLEVNRASEGLEKRGLYDETMEDIYEILYRKIVGLDTGDIIAKMRQANFERGSESKESLLQALKSIKAIN